MCAKPRKERPAWRFRQSLLGGVLLLTLILVLSMPAGAGPAPRLEDMEAVKHAKVTPDHKLDRLRGRLDTFLFGFNIVGDLNAGTGAFTGQVNFQTNVPLDQVAIGPSQVSFNNGQVSYNAGIGNTSFGSGIFAVSQVVGQNIIFISNVDVTLNIQGLTTPALTGLSTRPTTTGVVR